jgi:hypothetical protein
VADRPRVYYVGLLRPASNGQCDITDRYTARFGQLRPGQKVFIVTNRTKNGWKGRDSVTSAIVPPPPPSGKQQVPAMVIVTTPAATGTPEAQAAPIQGSSSLSRAVYKGSTPDAQEEHKGLNCEHPLSILCAPLVHSFKMALWTLKVPGIRGLAPDQMS